MWGEECSGWGGKGAESSTLLRPSACPEGTYKALAGNAPCSPCPARSHASSPAASVCPCLVGFFRASSDPSEAPCTGESTICPGVGSRTGGGARRGGS